MPIATRIAPKAPTMCLALIRAKALNVPREEVTGRHTHVPDERSARAYGQVMANKAPPSGQNKKQGKTLKEKRAAKKEKKAERSKRVI
jgi:hypothetical protein